MRKETDFERLMNALCVDQGYCGSLQDGVFVYVTDFIPKRGYVRVDDFLDWVFWAEGEVCEGLLAMRRREILRGLFLRHMGSDTVFAGRLQRPRRNAGRRAMPQDGTELPVAWERRRR